MLGDKVLKGQTEIDILAVGLIKPRLFLVFPVRASLGQLERHLASCMPSSEHLRIDQKRYADADEATIWRETSLPVTTELDPTVATLLGYAQTRRTPVFWKLDAAAREDINRRLGGDQNEGATAGPVIAAPSGFGLAIALSNAAMRRLKREEGNKFVPIRVASIDFYLSQTRLGQLVIELECGLSPVSAELLLEISHVLSHGQITGGGINIHRLSSRREVLGNEKGGDGLGCFSLLELTQTLACPDGNQTCSTQTPRAFTYVIATTEKALAEEQCKLLAARLARRHNRDYSPRNALEGVSIAAPFETVTHACTSDGGALLINNAASIPFLKDYANGPGEAIYLKLALLAHRNMLDLVSLSQGTAVTIEHSERDDDTILKHKLNQIRIVQERLLNYRLAHRFSLAGLGVNHNLVHAAWRKATSADEMLSDISADVIQASAYLNTACEDIRERQEAQRQTELSRQTSWLQAALVFMAVLEGLHALIGLASEILGWPSLESRAATQLAAALGKKIGPEVPLIPEELYAKIAAFIVALLLAIVAWRFARRGKHVKVE